MVADAEARATAAMARAAEAEAETADDEHLVDRNEPTASQQRSETWEGRSFYTGFV